MKWLFGSLLVIFALSVSIVHGQADISSDVNVKYELQENLETLVDYEITIKNIFTDRYATSYTLQLEHTSPKSIQVFQDGNPLEFTTQAVNGVTQVSIAFPNAVVGKGKTRTIHVSYIDTSLIMKNGDVWEVSIPRLGNASAFSSYDVELVVPEVFGDPAYISPEPSRSNVRSYYFSINQVADAGIDAAFGSFQVYKLNLKYHVQNPLSQNSSIDVALPPDTPYQKVFIEQINPAPEKLTLDEDGNWIANYKLSANEQKEITYTGTVQVFNGSIRSIELPNDVLESYLSPTEYWQSDDPQIVSLANQLRTPERIYDYVVETLNYNHDRVLPNSDRLGAVGALNRPNDALCSEFTDLFVALSRAAGIPAREINGYAYSENSSTPLSLVENILHAWPEYWDAAKKTWIPVDPTWEDTTEGVDYFSKLDLRHIAFAIHGKSDTLPYPAGSYKLGPYPENNVDVQIGELPIARESTPKINIEEGTGLPIIKQNYKIKVFNPGPAALYNTPVVIEYGDEKFISQISTLLPYGNAEYTVPVPAGVLAQNMPDKVKVAVGKYSHEQDTNKSEIALYHAASILLVILAITGGLVLYINTSNIKIWRH